MFRLACGSHRSWRISTSSQCIPSIRYPSNTVSKLSATWKQPISCFNSSSAKYLCWNNINTTEHLIQTTQAIMVGRYYATKQKQYTHKTSKSAPKKTSQTTDPKVNRRSKSSSTSKRKQSPYSKYLGKLLMKIHPDLYHRFPEAKEQNSKSLQTLNSLLETVDEFRNYFEASHAQKSSKKGLPIPDVPQLGSPFVPPFPASQYSLTFIMIKNAGNTSDGVLKRLESVVNIGDLHGIYNKRNLSKFFQVFEQRVGDALYDLMQSSNIFVPAEDRWDSQSENKWAWDPSQNPNQQKTGRQLLLHELRKMLLEEFENVIKPEAPEAQVDTTLMFFAPEVTEQEKQTCISSLKSCKSALNEYVGMWEDIPVLITKNSYDTNIKGFFSFPCNFEPEALAKYLKENLQHVREEREKIRNELLKASELRTKLVNILSLDGTLISKKLQSSQVIACLERLLKIQTLTKLSAYPLAGLNIYITGGQYKVQARRNNGVYIPYNFQLDELCTFLNGVHWKELQDTHINSKEHQGKVQKLVESIKQKSNVVHIQFMDTQFNNPDDNEKNERANTFSFVTRKDQLEILLEIRKNAELFNTFPFIEIVIGRSPELMIDDSMVDKNNPTQRLYKFYIPYRFPFQNVAAFLDAFWLQKKLKAQKTALIEKISPKPNIAPSL